MTATVYQFNFQRQFGGGEVYTRALCHAFAALGRDNVVFVDPEAGFWPDLDLPRTRLIAIKSLEEAAAHLPPRGATLLFHAPGKGPAQQALIDAHRCACMVHMPLFERSPKNFRPFPLLLPVSTYVLQTLGDAGLETGWPEPLYGIAELAGRGSEQGNSADQPIRRASRYDWDKRKGRDYLLSKLTPLIAPLLPKPAFQRRPGLTLGVVSRLTTIKQFPLLFGILAPLLAKQGAVNLEVFGSGGYASVRDLQRALAPLGDRVRFWGHQRDVAAVYGQLDYLLAGLPEREALGLNLLEAQACDLPVLAPAAPPFTETVVDGVSGYLYTDPRQDGGAHFARLLATLPKGEARLHPARAGGHLQRFSRAAFQQRFAAVLAHLEQEQA